MGLSFRQFQSDRRLCVSVCRARRECSGFRFGDGALRMYAPEMIWMHTNPLGAAEPEASAGADVADDSGEATALDAAPSTTGAVLEPVTEPGAEAAVLTPTSTSAIREPAAPVACVRAGVVGTFGGYVCGAGGWRACTVGEANNAQAPARRRFV